MKNIVEYVNTNGGSASVGQSINNILSWSEDVPNTLQDQIKLNGN